MIRLQAWWDCRLQAACGRLEDHNTWALCSGKIDRNVSGEVNAQELPMIQLFHRDACAPARLRRPAGTPRADSLEESGEQGHRVIVLSFAALPPGRYAKGCIARTDGGAILVRDDPDVRLNPRSGSQRGGASAILRLPER